MALTPDAPAAVSPRGRLAPSPTGLLHLGHARSFLLAWWQMRALGGEILLRMEDLDRERCSPEAEAAVLEDLQWLGLDWDGPMVRQSEREGLYASALERLRSAGRAYPCVCTRKEVALAASAPHGSGAEGRYPGTCRDRFPDGDRAAELTGRQVAWRFRVEPGEQVIRDQITGSYREDVQASQGDFPLTRKDGRAAYQLAVVVDDGDQGITHVLRADDLLSSTVRQAHLQEALALPSPTWFHVPLVVDADGERLAKRSDSLSLRALRLGGWKSEKVVEWVAGSVGLGSGARSGPESWIESFDLARLPRSPVQAPPP